MCNRLVTTLLSLLVFGDAAAYADAPAAVIAVTPFKQYLNAGKGWERQLGAVRDQVAGELVREYECTVLNRSYGYSLALEDAVGRLGVAAEQAAAVTPYGADYTFTGIFQPGVTNAECVLRIDDLREGSSRGASRTVMVGVPSLGAASRAVAAEIAKAAGLRKRAERPAASGGVRTWMVLPFGVTLSAPEYIQQTNALRSALVARAEAALQQDGRVRLVDRVAIEATLKEHALAALGESSAYAAASRLVRAERVLLGSVSAGDGEALRIDLLAVDTATAQVLAAATGTCAGKEAAGDQLANSVEGLLAALREPVALKPAGAAQREREARLYLGSAQKDVTARSLSGQMAVVDYAEMAYLVARDNPAVIGDIAKTLSRCNNFNTGMPKVLKRRIAEVADKIVAPYPEVANEPEVLLARARAHVQGGGYEAAIRQLEQFTKAYPDRIDVYVQQAMGECLLETGRPREALVWFADSTYHYRTLEMRLRAYRALGDEKAEFELMDAMTHLQLRELMVRYIELLAKRRGPQAAVDYIDGLLRKDQNMFGMRNDVQFLLAKNTLAAGDRKRAAALCQRLWDVGKANNWNWFYVGDRKAFTRQLEELRAQAGESDETWLTAGELQPFPPRCKLYIQPLGTLDTNLLEKARAGVEAFFGAPAEILPALELTREERAYHPVNNKYEAYPLINDTLRRLRVPADALAVAMVMREHLYSGGWDQVQSRRNDTGILISYFGWLRHKPVEREKLLRNTLIMNISNQLGLAGVFPCISAGAMDDTSPLLEKFAYSPEMQALYKKLDLAAEQEKAVRQFRKAGATIVEKP